MFKEKTYCGEIIMDGQSKEVSLAGWVDRKRDLGGIIFIELRDITGIVQVVFDSSKSAENAKIADAAKSEYIIYVKGTVRKRSADTINPNLPTGDIEVEAHYIEILNKSLVPPFPIDIRDNISEEVSLKFRYLDMRRVTLRDAIIKRHLLMQAIRKYLVENRFHEIETPFLNKSTPEGARDFIVPSRLSKGEFYALPQSPQLFKQILMVAGFDRYFQIVKCFRDEDLRNDRQPEFTQVDMELSFVTPDMIIEIIEGLLKIAVKEITGLDAATPFKRISYTEAMSKYGCDAPDTRTDVELVECSDIFRDSEFNVFKSALAKGGIIKGLAVQDNGRISRKMIDDYTAHVRVYGAKGFPMFKYNNGVLEGGISKFISEKEKNEIVQRFRLTGQALIFFSVDDENIVNNTLSHMRIKIAEDAGLLDRDKFCFLWVTEFPLFEYDQTNKRFQSKHHPFTAPVQGDIEKLGNMTIKNVDEIKSQAYDIVLNGTEIGGGSIRINTTELQSRIFSILGISEEEAREKFSFLLEALKYGAPPHGGIALGLDRILMILLKRNSIRDVIAFPKTQSGQCLMSNAPSGVTDEQLKELSIKVITK